MRHRILAGLLVVSCALGVGTGCGGGNHGSGAPVALAGIRGLTQEQIEGGAFTLTPRPPTINPLPNVTLTVQPAGGGHEIARKLSDAKGHFQIILSPGTYLISPLRPSPNFGLLSPPNQTVIVRAGNFTDLTFTYILEAP